MQTPITVTSPTLVWVTPDTNRPGGSDAWPTSSTGLPGGSGPQQDLPSALLPLFAWLSPVGLGADGVAASGNVKRAVSVSVRQMMSAACWAMRRCSSAAFHLAAAHSTFQLSSFRGMEHRLPGRRDADERYEIGLGPRTQTPFWSGAGVGD